ncbi:MAG: hypothetical protein AAF416_21955 [Pseudomonadota bacterium]
MSEDPAEALRDVLREAAALLKRERRLCLDGRLDEAGGLAAEKYRVVERLGPAMAAFSAAAAEDTTLRAEILALQAAARENERLLAGARIGLKRARRELARLAAARRGAVAYGADGGEILSREDASGRSKTA